MNFSRLFLFSFLLTAFSIHVNAQITKSVDEMEAVYKECLRSKPDSNACFKKFLQEMDSMSTVIFEKVNAQVPASEKSSLIQEQVSWGKKRGEYFKKLEETFVYNLQEGIWKKDMIRITYQQKAEYILKRVRVLLKRLKE